MTDNELDRLLNRWRTPVAPSELRARVLDRFPRRERRNFGKLLRWGLATAAVMGLLAIGSAQSGHGTLENLGDGITRLHANAINWVDHMWLAHILAAFRSSNPKIYVDGELRSDVVFGGGGAGGWLGMPGEGKYYLALSRHGLESPVPPPTGRFDGHVLEFQAGGRAVRIESRHTFGFGVERPVYVLGPVPR